MHSFPDTGNGAPVAGLIDVAGTMYGTAKGVGNGSGVVFRITTGGTFTVLHIFGKRYRDGAFPEAALLDVQGTLYGTTAGGGDFDSGTVFSISTSGKERVLYSFGSYGGVQDGIRPSSALIDVQGTLYGTTVRGGSAGGKGTVFSITTDGTENVIHSFNGNNGSQPLADLKNVKGVMYGTTSKGGANGLGTVFSITTSGEEKVLHSFHGGTGVNPTAGLVPVQHSLYGTTYGAVTEHHGNIFSLTP